jgi:superfamily II DNA or RNA helicase
MPTPFSSDDLNKVFDSTALKNGRSSVLLGAVTVRLADDVITGSVEHLNVVQTTRIVPSQLGRRVVFDSTCSCGLPACRHLAATALAALDRYPSLRKVEQKSLLDLIPPKTAPEPRRVVFDVTAGSPPVACFVAISLVGQRTGRVEPTTPKRVIAEAIGGETVLALVRRLGGGDGARTGVSTADLADVMTLLLRSGLARWAPTSRKMVPGVERIFDANSPPRMPAKSAILLGDSGKWYVDAATGMVGRVQLRQSKTAAAATAKARRPEPRRPEPRAAIATESERVIVERPVTPVLRMEQVEGPDESGRMVMLDALSLDFDYGGAMVAGDDDKQFVRVDGPGGPLFLRRDPAAEAAALEMLRQDGFVQMRVTDGRAAKGRRVLVFRGREGGESWSRFVAERVPVLQGLGWRSRIAGNFGPRLIEAVGAVDVEVADATGGQFSLEFGVEIEGVRHPLLPILSHLLDRGGIDAARIVGDDLITSLPDGRLVKLPADRIRRLLSIMGDLIEEAGNRTTDTLILPSGEAPTVLELEDLLATRWKNAASIEAYAARFRGAAEIPEIEIPTAFKGELRPYQKQGVEWLQHLRANGLGGFLADDMGLGKTAQTIAHIVVEAAEGRLDRPALVVVPTSLIPNWVAELGKFAPGLRIAVLHGLDRHERRGQLETAHVVITTYTVLARDIEEMKDLAWHLVVLDEAQAIKSPDAKATRAVCQLDTRFRLCLSGTPIENNLGELWSQFAFLMPGLLGDRRAFTKRFRTPIEKKSDDVRRIQLVRRIRPFIMRRTKSEVATELPPKHTILRRITLGPEQRELYEAIRVTLHDKVRAQVAERSLAQSRIVVLDALLKLRQACCDPRLVKLASARTVEGSSKLDDLMEMIGEMIPEGRRILLFSQFTSMLDLIKPRLVEAGIPFTELRGDTRDRGEPVRCFEAGEVPLFLISLKAGGRGLNLTSADTVIHYDPWWNPAVEDQASDRAHRIGQTKSVFVYKMIASDTVEERILELQQRKADLANIAFDEAGELSELGFDDIDFLFGADPERQAAAA